MPVTEKTVESVQGYSIVRITETDSQGKPVMETWAVCHEAGKQIDEFGDITDAVRALNRLLMPLPGIPVPKLSHAS